MSAITNPEDSNAPNDGQVMTAVRSLVSKFKGQLSGPTQITKTQIVVHFEKELELSESQAETLVDQLQTAGIVTRQETLSKNSPLFPGRNSQRWSINVDEVDENLEKQLNTLAAADGSTNRDPRQSVDLMRRAISLRATDVHITPFGEEFEVRFRIDGRVEHYCRLSKDVAHQITGQLKLMAEIDITEPFEPQEGSLELPSELTEYNVRMTVTPVAGGDAVALRILHRNQILRPLDTLGLSSDRLQQFETLLGFNEGLVLVTGPSGAGKTTTLYSLVHALDDGHRNIVSIEDPIEYRLPGFVQMEVDHRHCIEMSHGLRTILRMDPDIVLLGEIRDRETAEAAMRAASTGKYVFSSFHTRDVASVVTGLRDLQVDSRSLAGSLRSIVSQRLVRQLCQSCRTPRELSHDEQHLFERHGLDAPDQLFESRGCQACHSTGFLGRTAVFEVAVFDEGLAEAIEDEVSELELRKLLRQQDVRSLAQDALDKVSNGIIDVHEVQRIAPFELAEKLYNG